MPMLTILTATYNRADCLSACWNSLREQTCGDFQWLIIDDGSTDQTREVVQSFRDAAPEMNIEYHYKENGGKHTALNAAHPHIKGEYVVTLDSDDTLTPNAVEQILSAWERYKADSTVGRVIFLKGFSEDKPICYVKNENVVLDTLTEPRICISGRDCCDTFRTELFVKYPFPVFPGERFIGEGAAFLHMELESLGVYVNQVIYLCDYRTDGLTKAGRKMRLQNPRGGMYNSLLYMNRRLPMKTRIKKAILYACYCRFAGVSLKQALENNEYKAMTVLAWLPGTGLAAYWKKRYFND